MALTGTPQALTFTGATSGTIKDAAGGKGSLSGCTKTEKTFTARLAGMVAGTKEAYAVTFQILSYTKPGAYEVSKGMDLNTGAAVMIDPFDKSKLPMGLRSDPSCAQTRFSSTKRAYLVLWNTAHKRWTQRTAAPG